MQSPNIVNASLVLQQAIKPPEGNKPLWAKVQNNKWSISFIGYYTIIINHIFRQVSPGGTVGICRTRWIRERRRMLLMVNTFYWLLNSRLRCMIMQCTVAVFSSKTSGLCICSLLYTLVACCFIATPAPITLTGPSITTS